jgi:hypothetical protein
VAKSLVGVYTITGGIVGFMGRNLLVPERIVVISVGLTILCPLEAFSSAAWLNAIGLAALLGFFVLQKIRSTA